MVINIINIIIIIVIIIVIKIGMRGVIRKLPIEDALFPSRSQPQAVGAFSQMTIIIVMMMMII